MLVVGSFDDNIRGTAPETKCNYNIRIFLVINAIQVLTAYSEIGDAKKVWYQHILCDLFKSGSHSFNVTT